MSINLKRTALASAMVSVLVLGTATTALAASNTSTKSGDFIADTTTVAAGSKVNISIMGLNVQGEVDTKGEQQGSTIVAVVHSQKGEVEAIGNSGIYPCPGKFERDEEEDDEIKLDANGNELPWDSGCTSPLKPELQLDDVGGGATRYIKLEDGVGKVNISYPVEATGSDTIDITLQESYPNEAGGVTTNQIDQTTKTITLTAPDLTVKLLDIVAFTDGVDGNGDGDTDDIDGVSDDGGVMNGIDGVTTAGREDARIVVHAYKTFEVDDSLGSPNIPTTKGIVISDAVYGTVTVELRPKKAKEPKGKNKASESIILTGNMVKGEAVVPLPTTLVTAAGVYYIEATLEGTQQATDAGYDYSGLTSVDMFNDDTLTVEPVLTPKKLLLKSEKETISDDANSKGNTYDFSVPGTKLKACLLDEYGNMTQADQPYPINLKDDNGFVSNEVIIFGMAMGDVCVSTTQTIPPQDIILGDAKDEILNRGTAALVAYIKSQSAIAQSDEVSLKIVDKQLTAKVVQMPDAFGNMTTWNNKAPIQAGVSITDNVLGTDAFLVRLDTTGATTTDGAVVPDGVFNAVNDGVLDSGGPRNMVIRHYTSGGALIETTNSTIARNDDSLGARFEVPSAPGEYYIIADADGSFGEVRVGEAIPEADIIPASPTTYKMVNGHKQTVTSMVSTLNEAVEPVKYEVIFRENNLRLLDDFGNEVSPSDPVALLSSNSEAIGNLADFRANDLGTGNDGITDSGEQVGDYIVVKYDPSTFPGGTDNVSFSFTEPKVTGSDIAVEVPVLQELERVNVSVESGLIPVNGVFPMEVTSFDQFDAPYAHRKGLAIDIEAQGVAIEIYYVEGNGDETQKLFNGGEIPDSNKLPRSILAVRVMNGTTGTFTITARNADGNISDSETFEVTQIFESELVIDPTEVSVIVGGTADVTISEGVASFAASSDNEGIATTDVVDAKVTITGVGEGEAIVTVSDSDNNTVTVAVTVTDQATEEECTGAGNVYVEGECKQLPNTGGTGGEGSAAVDANGNLTTSDAGFSGGWTDSTGAYATSVVIDKNGGDTTATQVIRFDPDHVGQEVDIVLILAVQLPPTFGPLYWYMISGTSGIVGPALALDIAGIEALETHTVVADEPKVMGPYIFENLALKVVADFMFYFGYRTGNGTIYFSGEPIILQVR